LLAKAVMRVSIGLVTLIGFGRPGRADTENYMGISQFESTMIGVTRAD
jgi:hypothetical protein